MILMLLLILGFVIVSSQLYFSRPVVIQDVEWQQINIRTPNFYLMCPKEWGQKAHHSPVFKQPMATVMTAWQAMISRQPRVVLAKVDQNSHTYHYVQRSRVFRFPDVITVQFIAIDAETTTLALLSRSVVGYSDLGVNRQRVLNWVAQLTNNLANEK